MNKGFTLIEVVVALALAALVLGAASALLSSGARQAARLDAHARALALAESELARAGIAEPLAPGVAAGRRDGLAWRRVVESYFPPADTAGFAWTPYRVTIEVAWGGERRVRLSGVRLGAAP